jgi:hypothetical protein
VTLIEIRIATVGAAVELLLSSAGQVSKAVTTTPGKATTKSASAAKSTSFDRCRASTD